MFLAISCLALASCGGGDDDPPAAGGATTTAVEQSEFATAAAAAVRDVKAGDAALLDVRTDEEFSAGHAAGTIHLPLDEVEAGERPDLRKDRKLYVYCRTGSRAAVAVAALREDGYRDVTNIGGLSDWERAGGQVER